jgi:hypothetical protein
MASVPIQYDPEVLRRSLAIAPQIPSQTLAGLNNIPTPAGRPIVPDGEAPSAPAMPPDLGISTGQAVKAPRGTVQGDEAERTRLMSTGSGISQIPDKIENSQFGQAHPTLGKIAGYGLAGLAGLGDLGLTTLGGGIGRLAEQQIPGTFGHHQVLLNQANRSVAQDESNAEKEAQTANIQSEIPLRQQEMALAQAKQQQNQPVEITPEQAQAWGTPELAGEKVSPAILAALARQSTINATRKDTTGQAVAGRQKVAETGAQSREQVADTAARAREMVAEGQNRVRESLEGMKEAAATAKGVAGAGKPTVQTQNMAEMAKTVLPQMQRIDGEVDRLADQVGPAVGRWNELMVNKGGTDFPEFSGLDTDLDLLASAIVRTHFGARGGQQYRQELRKQFGEAQSPEDLKGRIAAARTWLQGYADMANPQQPAAAGGNVAPEGTVITVNGQQQIKKGGKWVPQP